MVDKGIAPKAATARFKSDIWCSLVLQRMEKKQHVGQTSNLQTMQRDCEILWEYNEPPQPRPKQTSLEQILAPKLPANSQRAHTITEAVAGFICKDIQPYRVVEDGSNLSLLTARAGA